MDARLSCIALQGLLRRGVRTSSLMPACLCGPLAGPRFGAENLRLNQAPAQLCVVLPLSLCLNLIDSVAVAVENISPERTAPLGKPAQ